MSTTKTNQDLSPALGFIYQYDNLPFSSHTVTLFSLAVSFSPMECNTNFDKDGSTENEWFQLLGNFSQSYSRNTKNGEVLNDNASLNNLKISISKDHMQKYSISGEELKLFFDKFYTLKRVLTIPLSSYSPEFENTVCGYFNADGKQKPIYKKTPVKNKYVARVNELFDLRSFIQDTNKLFDEQAKTKK